MSRWLPDDDDSPGKEVLETFLPGCLALVFPEAHAAIDWSKPYAFLDQELRQIQREAESVTSNEWTTRDPRIPSHVGRGSEPALSGAKG